MLSPAEKKQFQLLKNRVSEVEKRNAWLTQQLKTGLQDVIERMIVNKFEIDAREKSTEEKIKELIK